MSRKAKELETLLVQRVHENELMRKRIGELETEVDRLHAQEQSVLLAITEANRAAARINDDATVKAAAIVASAAGRREELLAEAKQTVTDAASKANAITADADGYSKQQHTAGDAYYDEKMHAANEQYDELMRNGDAYAVEKKREADAYANQTRTDANVYIERCVMAAQIEVNSRKNVIAELNIQLCNAAEYAREQSEYYASLVSSVSEALEAKTKEISADVDKCSCNCDECSGSCSEGLDADAEDASPIERDGGVDSCDNPSAESAKDDVCVKASITEDSSLPIDSDELISDAAIPAQSDEAESSDSDSPVFADNEETIESCEAISENETRLDDKEHNLDDDGFVPPDDYDDPASLMQSIYTIEGRELPSADSDDMSDASPVGGISFQDELDGTPFDSNADKLPSDSELDSILDEVLNRPSDK